MSSPATKRTPYDALHDVPPHLVAEVVAGVLYQSPRPAALHARAASILGEELGPPFNRSRGGPGGWIILDEPELHLGPKAEPDILVPDLAGWRRETLPELPDVPHFRVRPDWVCEVLSPSTHRLDRVEKVPVYAREGVAHVWLVDPVAQTLEVMRLDGATYRLIGHHAGNANVSAEPFDAISLELGALWMR